MRPTVRIEHELLAVQQQHRVAAMLELHAPPAPVVERPPLNVALVVDESGSMAGDKIATARRCARFLVERLCPTDRLAIVGFDTSVHLHRDLRPVDRDAALAAVDGMRAGSMTNLSGGWLKGVEELQRLDGADLRKVLLLSDGHANQGVTDRDRLATMVAGAAHRGIGTTTIGFGDGFDEELMTGMANAGRGNAHYAATIEDTPGIFAAEFDDLASTVAQNVSVEIRPTDDVEVLGILNDYPTTEILGGIQVQLGDTYGDEVRRLVFELHIPDLADLGVRRVADLIIRYTTVGDEAELHEVMIPITVNAVDAATASGAAADHAVAEQVTILRAAASRRRAQQLADESRLAEAESVLAAGVDALHVAALRSAAPEELLADARRLEYSRQSMAERKWSALDRKRMHYEAYQASRSRGPRAAPACGTGRSMNRMRTAGPGRGGRVDPPLSRAESIVGYRAWRIRIEARSARGWVPVLASLTAGTDWVASDLVASCDARLGRRRHPPGTRLPALDCSCGIYAWATPGDTAGFGHPMVAVGRVLLTGRVIEGRRGYRAERARIAGPLSVSLSCAHARCADDPVFAARVLGAPRPVCLYHLTLEPNVERVVTLDEFARALCSRLELRYGASARPIELEGVG